MNISFQSLGLDRLGIDERLELVEEILASLADNAGTYPLSAEQKAVLDDRLAAYKQNPADVVPLSDVMAVVTKRIQG